MLFLTTARDYTYNRVLIKGGLIKEKYNKIKIIVDSLS